MREWLWGVGCSPRFAVMPRSGSRIAQWLLAIPLLRHEILCSYTQDGEPRSGEALAQIGRDALRDNADVIASLPSLLDTYTSGRSWHPPFPARHLHVRSHVDWYSYSVVSGAANATESRPS